MIVILFKESQFTQWRQKQCYDGGKHLMTLIKYFINHHLNQYSTDEA